MRKNLTDAIGIAFISQSDRFDFAKFMADHNENSYSSRLYSILRKSTLICRHRTKQKVHKELEKPNTWIILELTILREREHVDSVVLVLHTLIFVLH